MKASLLFLVLLVGCSHTVPPAQPTLPPHRPTVMVAPHVQTTLAMVHYALLVEHEWGWCLEGEISGDTLRVTDMVSSFMMMWTETSATFSCHDTPRLVGFAHNHLPSAIGDGCWFSDKDVATQEAAPYALVSLVTCDYPVRLMARLRVGTWPEEESG